MEKINRDILGWLTNADIESTKYYAPQANRETLLAALKIERRSGAIAAIKRELFSRLRIGDTVYIGSNREPHRVDGITSNGKYITLSWGTMCGRWGWEDIEFLKLENTSK